MTRAKFTFALFVIWMLLNGYYATRAYDWTDNLTFEYNIQWATERQQLLELYYQEAQQRDLFNEYLNVVGTYHPIKYEIYIRNRQ